VRGWLWIVIGALVVLVGAVWALQGLNVLGGSVMSGQTLWAVVGPLVAIAGALLIASGVRTVRREAARRD
jgi:hypothetical protein